MLVVDERSLIPKARKLYGSRDTLDEIFKRGTLRVMVEFTPPPTEGPPPEFYYDPQTGEPTGVACELGKLMANDLQVDVEWVNIPWKDQLTAFLDGAADLLPKHTNTPVRGLLVDFSPNRFQPIEVVAVARRDRNIKCRGCLDAERIKLAIWHGSSNVELARRLFPNATIIEDQHPWLRVGDGTADAIITDGLTKAALEKFSQCDLVRNEQGERDILTMEYGHPAAFPGDRRFLNFINNFMDYHWDAGSIKYWARTWWQTWMAT